MARLVLPRTLGRLPVTDVVLAAALCVLAVGGLVTGQVDEKPLAITIPIAVVSTLLIALRTKFPLTVAGVFSVLTLAQGVFASSPSNTLWSLVVVLVATYTVAAERDEGGALVGLGLLLGAELACEWLDQGSDYAFAVLVIGGVWLFGRGTHSWHNQAIRAEQHQEDLARIAVAEERTHIARELHDVVAHSLTVIAVQADAAEAALATEPARAGAPMRAIRDSARDALADMRQLLHVLRREADEQDLTDLTPARGIKDLPQLVAGMSAAGLPLRADLRPTGALSSGMELATFRIVQEALTNVRKHAGNPRTRLVVSRGDGELRIEVHNDPPSTGNSTAPATSTGHGLTGVRERVLAVGGTLEARPTASGGFDLVARLPLDQTDGSAP